MPVPMTIERAIAAPLHQSALNVGEVSPEHARDLRDGHIRVAVIKVADLAAKIGPVCVEVLLEIITRCHVVLHLLDDVPDICPISACVKHKKRPHRSGVRLAV